MKGDRTNYGKGKTLTRITLRLTREEMRRIKYCRVSDRWSIADTVKQIIREHQELSER
jgi:hypothetical protein